MHKKVKNEHFTEGALEYVERFLINKFNMANDFIYDMHLFNSINFMNYYCDENNN